jgi:hypothetical protein
MRAGFTPLALEIEQTHFVWAFPAGALLVPGETWPTGLFPDVPRFEWPPVSEKSPGVLPVVVPGEAEPGLSEAPAAVPGAPPAPPPLSAANAHPAVKAIAVAKMIVVILMTSVSLFMVE